jgi:hypothetical protein
MSFVLAHRPHDRMGQEPASFKKPIVYKDLTYMVDIKQGGYLFKLKTPLFVNVEEGRIRGQVKAPIGIAIPKYDPEIGAYVMPDGSTVHVRGSQLIPITPPTITAPMADGTTAGVTPASGTATSSFSATRTATGPFGQTARGVSSVPGQRSRVTPLVPPPARIAPVSVRSSTAATAR